MAKIGKTPWNKGLKETRPDVIEKLSRAKQGRTPHNKNKPMSFEQKVKLSCAARKINLDEFDELKTPSARAERNKFAEMQLHIKCFERFNFRCDCCGLDKVLLNAHHLNSWKFFPDQRFDLANLVALCKTCHDSFHSLYGNGKTTPNTKDQYLEFRSMRQNKISKQCRKRVIVVAGVSGSGKSWVCSQLPLSYVNHDLVKKDNIRDYIYNLDSDIVLYDPSSHIPSFIKRNMDIFDIELVVIQETEDVIRSRLMSRGETFTKSIEKGMERMKNLAKRAVFTGTSSEVLEFLTNYCRSVSPE
jgi:5-methylcytosine-specific restriction endonuclease McrA